MNISEIKRKLIYDEGKRHRPYKCTAGKLTIGVGRNLEDVGISEATIDQMLSEDIEKCAVQAKTIFKEKWDTFSDERKCGIINMIFNLGYFGFCQFKMMISAINANDRAAIRAHGANSLWARQVGERAQRVLSLIADEIDVYPNGAAQ